MSDSIRNSVIVALVQTVVLVIGILGVAASHKLASKLGYPGNGDHLFFIHHAWLLMPVPLIRISVTGWLLIHRHSNETSKTAMFMAGLAIVFLFLTGAILEVYEPWSDPRQADSLKVTEL